MAKIQIHLPVEAADQLLNIVDPVQDEGAAGVWKASAQNPALSPIQRINAMSPALRTPYAQPTAPAVNGAPVLPSVASAPVNVARPDQITTLPAQGRTMTAPIEIQPRAPRSEISRIGGALGRIGGYALSALMPGVAAQIPSTPLGKIAAQNRELANELTQSRIGSEQATTEAEKGRTALERIQADRANAGEWRAIPGTGAEVNDVTGETRQMSGVEPLKPTATTPEDATLHDLMFGNNGQPRINPATNQPYTELDAYQAVKQAGQRPERFTSPFEAYAYGSPDQRKAAEDFISFEKKQGERYQRPGEIEQRYALYKRDPDAYKAMFGDREAAQDATQATRMLNYFEKQRKAIQDDVTLDDNEKQQQLAEIDSLEQPYLDIAQPGGNAPGAPPAAKAGTRNASRYKAGDEVTYKGQRMKILRILPSGKLELQAIGAIP